FPHYADYRSLPSFPTRRSSDLVADFSVRTVKSTTETSVVGTRKAIPVSLPFSSGITLVTATAAPVVVGIILLSALLPNRKFFFEGWSTVDWDAVTEWTVVINSSTIPKLSFMIFAIGARQFVVQDAFEIIVSVAFNLLWLTPITNIGAVLEGAEITTFLAPAFKCAEAESISLKIPVQSIIIS